MGYLEGITDGLLLREYVGKNEGRREGMGVRTSGALVGVLATLHVGVTVGAFVKPRAGLILGEI